jgi:hypothetical protein
MQSSNPVGCSCSSLTELAVEEFSQEANARRFRRVRLRGAPQWWLSLDICDSCNQKWLVAQEERFNDIYILRKISADEALLITAQNKWPPELDLYETLLLLGKAAGHEARFLDATDAEPIAIDLVGQRTAVSAQEFSHLTNLPIELADAVLSGARAKVAKHGYPFPWTEA